MRIAIVTETFLPKMDGIVRMLTEFLYYLAAQGHDALVIAPGHGDDYYAGFRVERFRGLRWGLYPGLTVAGPSPRLLAILRRWQPDLVHLAGPALLGAQAAVVARMLGIPAAAHYQTDLATYAGCHGLSALQPIAWHYLRAVHGLADRTYCPTPTVRRQLHEQGFRDLALCARGVDTLNFHPRNRSAALRDRFLGPGADPTTPIGVYVGRLSPEKNLDALLTIARARPELPLLIVGDGPERPQLMAALARHRAYFTGELRGTALATAYASADLLVCTSLTETFCQVAQEAMASGLPALAFRAGGVQDVVLHGETGTLCPVDDDAAWLMALDALTGDAALRHAYAHRARTIAEGRSWSALFERLLGEYQEIAASPRRSFTRSRATSRGRRPSAIERR